MKKYILTKMTVDSVRYWQNSGYWTDDKKLAKQFDFVSESDAETQLKLVKADGIEYLNEK